MSVDSTKGGIHKLGFDYGSLGLVEQQHLQQKAVEIKERLQRSAQDIWEIGQRLVEVRSHLKHGQFELWLKAEFGWSRRTAYNFISIYETFDKSATVAQINATTSALYSMAAPSTSETVRSELLEREQQGERITREAVREAVRQERSTQPGKRARQGNAVPLNETSSTPPRLPHKRVSPDPEPRPATVQKSTLEIVAVIPQASQTSQQTSHWSASEIQAGWYQLGLQHRLFCGDTAQAEFVNQVPYASLILGITADDWDHDWMIEQADNIIILRESALAQRSVEQVISTFSEAGDIVVFPWLPYATMVACAHRLKRKVLAGDPSRQRCAQAIAATHLNAVPGSPFSQARSRD